MDLAQIVADIGAEMAAAPDRGKVADYIPELGAIDPARFGMAIVTADGEEVHTGDATTPFSIQSISKVFTLALALGRLGDQLWQRVGREPSGLAFNSILQLESEAGIPRNPFINAGALSRPMRFSQATPHAKPWAKSCDLSVLQQATMTSISTPRSRSPSKRRATAIWRWHISCAPTAI